MRTIKISMITTTLFTVACSLFAAQVQADPPDVRIYFDSDLTISSANCPPEPPGTVIDTVYVVAENFTDPISRIEYRLLYGPQLSLLWDAVVSGTTTGNTSAGIVHTWAIPQDASGKLVLAKSVVMWMCDDCLVNEFATLCVDSHPGTGYLRACGHSVDPVSCIVTVPVESTSWGHIKSMYD
ncbi:MAG: hypothetical protein ACYSR6_10405 [Planctomycetota bacterium]